MLGALDRLISLVAQGGERLAKDSAYTRSLTELLADSGAIASLVVLEQLSLAGDRVMTEGSVYDRELAGGQVRLTRQAETHEASSVGRRHVEPPICPTSWRSPALDEGLVGACWVAQSATRHGGAGSELRPAIVG